MPKHVGIILDGNRRWANKRGLRVSEGHEAGARTVLEHAMDCFAMGINTLSLFAFSTENWGRPDVSFRKTNNERLIFVSHKFQDFLIFHHFRVKLTF